MEILLHRHSLEKSSAMIYLLCHISSITTRAKVSLSVSLSLSPLSPPSTTYVHIHSQEGANDGENLW